MSVPNPTVKSVVDAMMRQVRAVLGPDAVAKLQAEAKSTTPPQRAGFPPSAAANSLENKPNTPLDDKSTAPPSSGGAVPAKLSETDTQAHPSSPMPGSPRIPAELTVAMFEAAAEGDWKTVDGLAELGEDAEGLEEFLADRDAGTAGVMTSRAFAAMSRNFSALSGRRLASPTVAGLAVRAASTGRVLMLRRADTPGDPAANRWEFPGGHLKRGEHPEIGAKREWIEETGQRLPEGKLIGSWHAPNGVYTGYVWEIDDEGDVSLAAEGDQGEPLKWWPTAALTNNPDVRAEVVELMPNILPLLNGLRTFSAHSPRTFSWFHDPTPRSKSRITNSESGAHAYGDAARRLMESQGREERGEPHPETPKAALQRMKAEREPAREAARQAYQKALSDPGSLTGADLNGLREHLHTLTRDEVRQNLRAVMFKAGGKLKADLVDGLLEHVRGKAIEHHESKLDPMGMGLDQDIAQNAIADLQGAALPADKKARDQKAEAEWAKTHDHNKRREERQQLQNAGTAGELDAPEKVSHGTPDVGSKLKQPDKMLDIRTLDRENREGLTLDQQVKKPEAAEAVPVEPKPVAPSEAAAAEPAVSAHNQKPTYTTDKPSDAAVMSEVASAWLAARGGDLSKVDHDAISAAARSGELPRKVEVELRRAKVRAEEEEDKANIASENVDESASTLREASPEELQPEPEPLDPLAPPPVSRPTTPATQPVKTIPGSPVPHKELGADAREAILKASGLTEKQIAKRGGFDADAVMAEGYAMAHAGLGPKGVQRSDPGRAEQLAREFAAEYLRSHYVGTGNHGAKAAAEVGRKRADTWDPNENATRERAAAHLGDYAKNVESMKNDKVFQPSDETLARYPHLSQSLGKPEQPPEAPAVGWIVSSRDVETSDTSSRSG